VGNFPAIAGMEVASFVKAMNDYKSGARPSPMMSSLAGKLTDEDIRTLANYYASLGDSEL
jgi:cytochrome c553